MAVSDNCGDDVARREADFHASGLGSIVANLHSLEISLRAFLEAAEASERRDRGDPPVPKPDYFSLKKGEWVDEDPVTDYDTLAKLVDKYNARIASVDSSLCVDSAVVDLRDALAHGRVISADPTAPMCLHKFGPPRQKRGNPNKKEVQVTFVAEMNRAWFKQQIRLTLNEIVKVTGARKKLAAGGAG